MPRTNERVLEGLRRWAIRTQKEAASRFDWNNNPSYFRVFKDEFVCDQLYVAHGYEIARQAMDLYQTECALCEFFAPIINES